MREYRSEEVGLAGAVVGVGDGLLGPMSLGMCPMVIRIGDMYLATHTMVTEQCCLMSITPGKVAQC